MTDNARHNTAIHPGQPHDWRVGIEGNYPDLEVYGYCRNTPRGSRITCHLDQDSIERMLTEHGRPQSK